MPKIKSKAIENYKAAMLLSNDNNKMYSASIHCAYYACFQFTKHILAQRCCIPYNQQKKEAMDEAIGTHNYVINEILNHLNLKNECDAYDIYHDKMSELKRLRTMADYDNIIISPVEAHKAMDFANDILDTLKGVYKGL